MTITVCAADLCLSKVNDLGPDGSNKLDAQGAAHRTGGPAQGVQHHGLDGGVEQSVKLAAAGVHPLRRSGLGQPVFFHRSSKLTGDDFFNRVGNGSYGS